MQRRELLIAGAGALGALSTSTRAGNTVRKKRRIDSLGKTFAYLQDPELRRKETGDSLLTIEDAEIHGVRFEGLAWQNMLFKNCDFLGAYEVKLVSMNGCRFSGCRFSGIFAWGVQNAVRFSDCGVAGASHLWGAEGSSDVVYERCNFIGANEDSNHWGSVGTYGEAVFNGCKGKWFGVLGHSVLVIRDCEFDSMECPIDARESNGIIPKVQIEGSRLRRKFDLTASNLHSLTVLDTVFEEINLSDATVKADILFERVKGGFINAYVKQAARLSVRNSQIFGNGTKVFEAYAGGIGAIEIDNVVFGGDLSTEPVTIAGGTGLDLNNVRARVNDSIVIRGSKVPRLNMHHLHTSLFQMKGCALDSLVLSNSRIARLELSANTIARSVDFTDTQAKESKVQPFAKGQAKLDGSNIKPG
jgi:uncharacterized protein YjbI with pentapeptide repeats